VERPEVYAVTKKGNERVEENVPEDAAFRAKLVEMLETALVSAGYHIAIDTNVKHEITLRTEWFGWKTDISRFWEHCAGVAKFNFSLPLKQSALVQISEACPWNLDEVAKLVVNQLTSSPRFRQVATTNESVQNPPSPAAISQSTTPTPVSTNPSLNAETLGPPRSIGGSETLANPISAPIQPGAYAVIVGVQTYQDGLPASEGATADAESFKRLAKETLGIPDSQVRFLIEGSATKANVERALDWARNSVSKGGRIYFYFAGHGAPDPVAGDPFLVPRDGDPAYLESTAIPLGQVLTKLGQSQAREVLVFLDSCFSGVGSRSLLPKGARPLVRMKEVVLPAQVAVYSSSANNETSGAMLGQGHGLFTYFLVEALGKGLADLDGDGQISMKELDSWVAPRVKREARKQNRSQTPTLRLGHGLGRSEDFVVESGLQ
jgi:hypothetical protein